ncbi:MAG: ABC transporter ATP-binding protein [Methanoregulaceae archaeon]|nr:ABC transporter ATP-binding protein [Methanoregulaceae archaeon]
MKDTVIEVSDLSKSFDGTRVLSGISFSVSQGEVFGFLGPNGAGKTTTMRILLGLLRPDSGNALVLGRSLAVADAVRGSVGVLLEHNGLIDRLSAFENLDYYARLYGVRAREARIAELLEFAGLSDRKDDLVGTFSTGMKRKIGLARAILHDPRILFLDEPTSGLDPEAQAVVRELILQLSAEESMTVFLNSHNLDEVQRICSAVAVLDRGVIRAFDSVEHLRAGEGIGYELVLADPGQRAGAVVILSQIGGATVTGGEGDRIALSLGGVSPSDVLSRLVASGIAVEEARKTRKSLEEIYLGLVAKRGEAA